MAPPAQAIHVLGGAISPSPSTTATSSTPCYILEKLPWELRDEIWSLALSYPSRIKIDVKLGPIRNLKHHKLALMATCKQIRQECGNRFFKFNKFHVDLDKVTAWLPSNDYYFTASTDLSLVQKRRLRSSRNLTNGDSERISNIRIHFDLGHLKSFQLFLGDPRYRRAYLPATVRPYVSRMSVTIHLSYMYQTGPIVPIQLPITDREETRHALEDASRYELPLWDNENSIDLWEDWVEVLCGHGVNARYEDHIQEAKLERLAQRLVLSVEKNDQDFAGWWCCLSGEGAGDAESNVDHHSDWDGNSDDSDDSDIDVCDDDSNEDYGSDDDDSDDSNDSDDSDEDY